LSPPAFCNISCGALSSCGARGCVRACVRACVRVHERHEWRWFGWGRRNVAGGPSRSLRHGIEVANLTAVWRKNLTPLREDTSCRWCLEGHVCERRPCSWIPANRPCPKSSSFHWCILLQFDHHSDSYRNAVHDSHAPDFQAFSARARCPAEKCASSFRSLSTPSDAIFVQDDEGNPCMPCFLVSPRWHLCKRHTYMRGKTNSCCSAFHHKMRRPKKFPTTWVRIG